MSLLNFLSSDNFITVNRSVAEIVGLDAAIILGELASEYIYWESKGELKDGYFYSTIENLADRTYLSAYLQRQALDKLKSHGFIDIKKKGMPAKRYIRINEAKIVESLQLKLSKNLTTSGEISEQQVVAEFDGKENRENKKGEKEKSKDTLYTELLQQTPIITQNEELKKSLKDFIEMRKKIKAPLTERAFKMIVNEAYKLGKGNPDVMAQIINQSILHDWKGVYPLKEEVIQENRGSQTKYSSNNPFTDLLKQEGYQSTDDIMGGKR